jgi:SAM-dependent methyltransferase
LLLIEDSIKNELNNLGLYDNEHCIMCNSDTIEDKIKWILDSNNRAEVDRIRNNGMTLVRKIHTTKMRASTFDLLVKDKMKPEVYLTYKNTFDNIYKKGIWNNNDSTIPLSGPGSSINATKDIAKELNDFIYKNTCKSVLDLGCGDLTWIKNTQFFNDSHIEYTGVDIVESLINNHKNEHINKKFICSNIITFNKNASLVIIRDVIFHLKIKDIEDLFNNIRGSFEYIAITSCNNDSNNDNLNFFHFAERNIFKPPFNILTNYEIKVDEVRYNRGFYIFSHDNFYKVYNVNILVN